MPKLLSVVITLVLGTFASSAAPIASAGASAPEPIYAHLGLGSVRGLVYHEAADRIVVAGDNEVQIFRRDGIRTHRMTGISEARGAEAVGDSVVVAAAGSLEMVIIDPARGVELERHDLTGNRGQLVQAVGSIAADGDTIWYAHQGSPFNSGDRGIGKLSISDGTVTPMVHEFAANALTTSPAHPGDVFALSYRIPKTISAFAEPNNRTRSAHQDHFRIEAAEEGEVIWTDTSGAISTLDADTLELEEPVFEFPTTASDFQSTELIDQLMATHGSEFLAAIKGVHLAIHNTDAPESTKFIEFRSYLSAVDVTKDQVFVVESGGRSGVKYFPSRLAILDHNFVRPPLAIDVYVDSLGVPPDSRPVLKYACGDTVGGVHTVAYGQRFTIEMPWSTLVCDLVLENVPNDQLYGLWLYNRQEWRPSSGSFRIYPSGDQVSDEVAFLLEFANVFNDADTFVRQQFEDLLRRAPTKSELTTRSDRLRNGTAPESIVTEMVESPEFIGSVAPLTRLYLAYFERQPDDGGLDYWLQTFRSGTDIPAISDYFAVSEEFGNTYGDLSDEDFIKLVYQNVLDRDADAEGLGYWLELMNSGMSRGELMTNFSESVENIRNVQPQIIVRSLYYGLLRREPDQAGFEYWTEVYAAGGSLNTMVRAFLDSDEYFRRAFYVDPQLESEPRPETRLEAQRTGFSATFDQIEVSELGQ